MPLIGTHPGVDCAAASSLTITRAPERARSSVRRLAWAAGASFQNVPSGR